MVGDGVARPLAPSRDPKSPLSPAATRANVAVSGGKTARRIAGPAANRASARFSSEPATPGRAQATAKQAAAPSSDRGTSDGSLAISQSPTRALPSATTYRKTFASTFRGTLEHPGAIRLRCRAMAYGILSLRVVVGLLFFAHGAQKLFGWFGGHGPRGTAGFLGSLGFRRKHALPMALAAGLSEAAGLLFAFGLLTPFAALATASVMVVAVATVHRQNGLWSTAGGFEYNLVLWTVAIAVAAGGPGRFSLDAALGWVDNLSGVWWGAGVLVASLLGGALVMRLREPRLPAEDTDAALTRESEREAQTIVS